MAIAVDVMGGDFPLSIPIEGAIAAVNDFGIDVQLVGDQQQIQKELQAYTFNPQKVEIVHCTEVVEMQDSPALAIRQKKDSSIRVAINQHRQGKAEAVVSAGHSGATMATAKFVLKSIEGIDRPAIATIMPSVDQHFVMIDVGANTDCKLHYLLQFAFMGDAYARTLLKLESPRVGLLSNGEEESKGTPLLKEAYELLKQSTLNFQGNVEGKGMFAGAVDVVVCDGFVGNVTLKVAEGTFDFIQQILKNEIQNSRLAQIGYLAMKKPFEALKKKADYQEVGGAPLLGIKGSVIICHGNSKPQTLRNAIRHAKECADLKLNATIAEEISENHGLLLEAEQFIEGGTISNGA